MPGKSVRYYCGVSVSDHFWKLRRWKVRAVVTQSAFPSQTCKESTGSRHFWSCKCLFPHIAMWFVCFSCSIPPPPPPAASCVHHQHITLNTTPSVHNIINTSPSTQHHQHIPINTTQHHQHNIINISPSTQHHQHNIINTTSSTHHHPHSTINTSPSTQHHQHNIMNTSPSTQHHQHNIINTTSSTQHHQHNTINPSPSTTTTQHQHNTSGSFCVAGAALGAPQVRFASQVQHLEHLHRGQRKSGDEWCFWAPPHFAWQAQHLEHLRLVLRGRCSTWSTSGSFCVAGAALGAPSQRSAEVRRRVMTLGAASFCVAGAALGAPQARFAWQALHLGEAGSLATSDAFGRRLVLRGRRSTWSTSGSFSVAGAWQAQHLEHLHRGRRKSGGEWCFWAPPRFAWQGQHLEHLRLALRGRRSTRSTSGRCAWQVQHLEHLCLVLRGSGSTWFTKVSFCMAGAALDASPVGIAGHFFKAQTIHTTPPTLHHQTHHHQDNTVSTTSSTQSHQHNFINASPSTQHHLHNTIYTTSSTQHHLHYIIKHNIINTHHLHESSTQHHQHNLINTSPSTKHHLHNTIYTTPSTPSTHIYTTSSNTGRCSTWSTAILALLPHSCWYPFCYSLLRIVLCSVLLTYSTVGCPKTLLACGVVRFYNFCVAGAGDSTRCLKSEQKVDFCLNRFSQSYSYNYTTLHYTTLQSLQPQLHYTTLITLHYTIFLLSH